MICSWFYVNELTLVQFDGSIKSQVFVLNHIFHNNSYHLEMYLK